MTILTRSPSTKAGNVMVQSLATFAGTALTALMVFAGSAGAQVAPSQALAPTSDFSKICTPAPKPFLTRDWSKWDKSQPVVDPEEMYDAAVAYAEGSATLKRDPVTAKRLLEDLSERAWSGRGRAHYRLGKLLLDPIAGPVDPERAAAHLATASSMLNLDASVLLAELHEEGRIGNASLAEAERLLRAASTAGHVDGLLGLARLQRSGRLGTAPQTATNDLVNLALQSLHGDLSRGRCSALYRIGLILSDESLVPGGVQEAIKWFEAGARQGDINADLALAEIYLQERAKAAPDRFISHLERAAEGGKPRAMTLLGERLMLGDKAPKDVSKGIAWLERAGLNADPEAYKLLARHYRGEFGAGQDLPKAADALLKASRLPGHSTSVLVNLARLYAAGVNGQPDVGSALTYYRQAANRGDVGALTDMAKLLLSHPQEGRPEEPLRLLKEAAARNDPDAMGALADLYACSAIVAPDPSQARAWLDRAAEMGHIRSILAVASQDVSDEATARKSAASLLRAAERGDRESMVLLSHALRSGQGVKQDQKAADRWRDAALAPGEGRSRALLLMARRILSGEEENQDVGAARTLLEQAAREGEPGAQLELGRLLIGQRENRADMLQGVQLLQAAAASANAAAMLALSDVPGELLSPTGRSAQEWKRAAAETGNARAVIALASAAKEDAEAARWLARAEASPVCATRDMIELAQAYHKAAGPRHDERARHWMEKAIGNLQGGAKDPVTSFMAGRAMIDGVGGWADKEAAIAHIRFAADAGRVDAMRYLGRGYISGQLGERNMQMAVEWLSKAMHHGDGSVAADLSRLAATPGGEGVAAVAALKKSAEGGVPSAMREYGRSLQLGLGTSPQPDVGASWLRKAAEAGDIAAMKELSRAYASGYGVELSARSSTEWLQRAAQAGDAEAMQGLSLAMTLGFGTDVDPVAAQEWLKTAEGATRK
ncbi:tetratricopeptide repeat protein [Microvirga splendida]|uniref:Sel1 repeat family protein n=1 Tax=Microvirga splendida TaxID=2795727 RepID=A0ABS0XX95_9HYPH|nr:tetratricopeptide repeat protein [Microvirga splendida]MBJ6124667.1 sel1 repeat family protein [Microvirga splendida]